MSEKNIGWVYEMGAKLSDETKLTRPVLYMGNLMYDPKSILLKNRIIKLNTVVDEMSGDYIQDLLLTLDVMEDEGKGKDITMYINSPGGSVIAGLAIYDTMMHIKSDVRTVCIGMAASMASVLLAVGSPGKRYALPNSIVMIHQVASGSQGKLRDLDVSLEFTKSLEDKLLDIYIKHMPKDDEGYITRWGGDPYIEKIDAIKPEKLKPADAKEWLRKWAGKQDRFLNAEQALALGFVDSIIKAKELPHR